MIVLEHESKRILERNGIAVPEGRVASSVEDAVAAAAEIGDRVVVKAQVRRSDRAAHGGIRFADSSAEARRAASDILGSSLLGAVVESVLVEQRLPTDRQLYVGATYDPLTRRPILLATDAGGSGVEHAASFETIPFSSRFGCPTYKARALGRRLGLKGREQLAFGHLTSRLAKAFLENDSLLFELNPVTLFDGNVITLDAHLEVDDDALGRQPLLAGLAADSDQASRTPLERAADEIDGSDHRGVAGRLVEFGGSLGLLIGGGGASLTVFDFVLAQGLDPANYCEIGGNPTKEKVSALTQLLLSQPSVNQVAVIMNVTNNTRADIVAEGVVEGILAAGQDPLDAVAVFRVPGPDEERCRAILAEHGIEYHGAEVSLEQAVEAIALRSRQVAR